MSVSFPFEEDGKIFFGKVYRPVADVSFQAPEEGSWVKTQLIVDTGADFTLLPRNLAQLLHISLERDCKKETTFGVGGEQPIYLCKKKIKARVGNIEREVPIAFFDSNEVPALLGRLGFLETFDVAFLKKHEVVFTN